jgi:outer membrane protein
MSGCSKSKLLARSGLALLGTLLLGSLGAAAQAEELKIAVVNYARLMQESPQAKSMQNALRSEFAGKQQELQTEQASLKTKEAQLERDAQTMSPEQRTEAERQLRDGQRRLSEKVNEYQDDFNARQNAEMSKLSKILVDQVQVYAQSQKFDLVLAEGVIFANPTIDITQPILAALQARGATAATPSAAPSRSTAARPPR